jgi:hypothetical protein
MDETSAICRTYPLQNQCTTIEQTGTEVQLSNKMIIGPSTAELRDVVTP